MARARSSDQRAALVLDLVTPARPDGLDRIHDLVRQLWQPPDVGVDDRNRFESAVAELAGNIIEHGVPREGADSVLLRVSLRRTETELTASFQDDGRSAEVDLAAATMPDCDAEGGRGLALVRALCDDAWYRHEDGVNRWEMRCLLTP